MYVVRSISNGKWQLDGAQNGEQLTGLVISFMEGKAERNGNTTYYVAGPAFAKITVAFSGGQEGTFENVPVSFD